MSILHLKPTEKQTSILLGRGAQGDLVKVLDTSRQQQAEGRYEEACNIRFQAFQHIVAALPDDEAVELDASHANTAAAMEIILASAIDHYLVGDAEMAAAQLELLLDCDSEDHLGATQHLALCYIALEEWDMLDEMLPDLDERTPHYALAALWLALCHAPEREDTARATLRRHGALLAELQRDDHPADRAYLDDINSPHPTPQALARELYLQYEPLFEQHPDVLERMKHK